MMNHDGSQQYAFGYGLATTPQIQQIQLQQHHFQQQQTQHHPQILQQHQGNPTASISTQNVFQLQVGGNTAAAAILQQQSDNAVAAASPTIVQHAGLISQPVIHANISVSLENTINKPLQVQGLNNSMEAAMIYPQAQHQGNGLKIITNSGSFMQQQQQPELHFQSLATADNLVNSSARTGLFDGVASGGGVVAATQSNIGTAFGKQTFSGWVQGDVTGGGNQQHYNVGQSATLPSFGHLWSQFQQQKTQVNIIQQQHQQQQPMQVHQFQSPHPQIAQQASQQFTVSGMQNVNNIQMIKVQQTPNALHEQTVLQPAGTPATHLFQSCATPVQQNLLVAAQHTGNSSPLPQIDCLSSLPSVSPTMTATSVSAIPAKTTEIMVGQVNSVMSGVTGKPDSSVVSTKKSNKNVHRKLKSISRDAQLPPSSTGMVQRISSSDTAVRIKPSNRKALSESGPPKVTVTLDSLPSTNNLSQFPEKPDGLHQAVKGTTSEKVKFLSRNQLANGGGKFDRNQSSLSWQHQLHTNESSEKKRLMASNHLTSSTGSSLERPSSEDSNFSSPPYSFTPPSSIDSVFSPPSLREMIHPTALNSADIVSPTMPSSLSCISKSTNPSSPPLASSTSVEPSLIENNFPQTNHLNESNTESQSSNHDKDALLISSTSPSLSLSQTSVFTNSLISASCCSIAITTTSVTSSSPRTKRGDIAIAASVHSLSPLSSPGISSKSKKAHHRIYSDLSSKKEVRVPYSWERNLEDGVVVYLSPSGAVLTSPDEIRDYLLSHDTCKCGLECPFQLEDVFVFDPAISSMPWCKGASDNSADNNPMGNLCNHRREVLAMAAFHQSQTHARQVLSDADNARGRKREGRKSFSAGDDFVISPLKKLRTSITNAVNRHVLLRNNNTSPANTNSNLPSPMSELENSWQKDDDVFFPISTNLNNTEESFGSSSNLLSNRILKGEKRQKILGNSENLVYSNHHPSQRLGSKGQQYSHQLDHSHQNVPLSPHNIHKSPSSRFSPHNVGDPFLYRHQACSSHENQKSMGALLHNNNNNCDTVDKERNILFPDTSPNLLCFSDDDSNSEMLISQKEEGIQLNDNVHNLPSSIENQDDSDNNGFHSLPQTPSSLSAVSFFENPTAFVTHQTAMINSSISSCNINSPSPGFLDDSVTLIEPKSNGSSKRGRSKSSTFLVSEEEGGDENHLDTSREDDEEHKGNTDLESNKSFSDTTENNDSAYLSQTGSDQEKSDTVDGLDCLSKSSDVYDFNASEEQLGNVSSVDRNLRGSLSEQNSQLRDSGIDISEYKLCEAQMVDDASGKEKFASPSRVTGSKSLKCKQNRTATIKKKSVTGSESNISSDHLQPTSSSLSLDESLVSTNEKISIDNFDPNMCSTGSLNRDLSQLLASNNWNIPALQKVLAKHSAGDPEHLRQVIQQMMTQITSPNDSSYPGTRGHVSNLNSNAIVSNVAAAFSTSVDKQGVKQENFIEPSVVNDFTAAVNRNTISLTGMGKCNNNGQASTAVEKLEDQTVGGDSCKKSVSPTATNKTNTTTNKTNATTNKTNTTTNKTNATTKQEPVISKPSPSLQNNNRGSVQSVTVCSVSSIPSTSFTTTTTTKVTTLSSASTSTVTVPQQSSLILNSVKPQTTPIVPLSSSSSKSIDLAATTTTVIVSKPLQMTHVIPNNLTGINQTTTVLPPQQFLATAPAQQLLNPCQHPSSQNSPQQQIMNMNMNSLSLPGLNNPQLFISNNQIQQASPSSVATAQLSPAMAAAAAAGQILAAQTQHQQSALQQQMSPSFIPTAQIAKPCSVSISSLAMPNNAPGISIAAGNNPTGVADVTGSIPQGPASALAGNVITGPPQNSAAVVAAANASIYSSATNQPVFVIPQAKPVQQQPPPPVVQLVGGSSQTINPAANGLQAGDVNMNQILSQISADQNQQLQNLINAASAGSFNPAAAAAAATLGGIQQQQAAWNTVNLNAQQQQQQQLQLLQLQQLLLPTVIGNQPQTLPNTSVCCPPQTSSLMNAMVGQQGLQINQVVDVKAIQQNLTPAAATQGFNNLPSVAAPAAFSNQIQQMASPLTVQVGSAGTNQAIPSVNPQVSISKPINIIQHQQQPQLTQQQALQTCLPSGIDSALKNTTLPSLSTIPVPTNKIIAAQPTQTINTNNKATDKEDTNPLSQQLTTAPSTKSTAAVSNSSAMTKSTNTSTTKPSSSKSKSKSKKSDSNKVKDPQAAKEEEHIANAVNQILAQAVQQQRELTLAAQNAPPPPPKSRNRKRDSQARARQAAAAQAAAAAALQKAKEQELGKIASISDDAIFHHPLQPPKALPSHTPPPLPLHNLSNGSPTSPLSSSLSSSTHSFSSASNALINRQQEPVPPQSLSHLVSNKNPPNTSSKQFAILSSQSSNIVGVRPTTPSTLPLPPQMTSTSSGLMKVPPSLTSLPNDSSPLQSQPFAARLPFISTPSSTLAAVSSLSSSSASKIVSSSSGVHRLSKGDATQILALPKNPTDTSSFEPQMDTVSPPLNRINFNSRETVTTGSSGNISCVRKVKNTLPSITTSTILNSTSSAGFQKSPPLTNPLPSSVVSACIGKPPLSSASATPKKGSISLKEHLSSIVFSKDKDSGKKKGMVAKSNIDNSNVTMTPSQGSMASKTTKLNSVMMENNAGVPSNIASSGLNDNKPVAKATRSAVNGEAAVIVNKTGRIQTASSSASYKHT